MKQKGFMSILLLLVIAALVGVAGYLVFTQTASAPTISIPTATSTPASVATSTSATILLQVCPDIWYDNQMPTIIEPGMPRATTQYFIYQGERRELSEFDMNWVRVNCSIKPSVVY